MAKDHRRADAELAQGVFLLDDPGFLKEIVERVLQELLEAQIPSTWAPLLTSGARIAPDIVTATSRGP